MRNKEFKNIGGGATPLSQRAAGPAQQEVGENLTGHEVNMGSGDIRWEKILRYYDTKAVRSKCRHGKSDLQYVILNCLRQDNTLNIGGTSRVILNLFQDLKNKVKPLSLNPSPLRGEGKVGRHYQADRKYTVGLVNPTYKKLKRFFAGAQNDKNTFLVPYCLSNLVSLKKAAFTLAEVLITLGIIGIVAAMTIPTLVSNYKQKVLNNQFKKTYAMLNQALLSAQSQLGYIPVCYYYYRYSSLNPSSSGCDELSDKFWTQFKVAKICDGKAFEKGCIPEYEGMDSVANANKPDEVPPEGYEDIGEYESRGCTNFRKNAILNERKVYVLADGTIIIPYSTSPLLLAVDINGNKAPNKWGYDLFSLQIRFDGEKFRYYGGGCMYAEEGGHDTATIITKLERNQL